MTTLVIKNGLVFLGDSFEKKDVSIENGLIKAIDNNLQGDETIDADGFFVLPGLIDPHVHLREPGDDYKEDFTTGGRAAIAGGFTTVIDMPNNKIPTTTKERLEEKIKLAKEKALCDVFFHFGGTDDNFDEIREADPISLKLYLAKTTGELMLHDSNSLEKHFVNFPKDRPIVLHACGDSKDQKENLDQGYSTTENALDLASKIERKVHLAHASTKKEIEIAKGHKTCTIEVAPHHLFLSTNDAEKLGAFKNVYPILRSETERTDLWGSLQMVDCIATDHAPHTVEDKKAGASGFPGLETSLALMLTACDQGLIDRVKTLQKMSENPGKIFKLGNRGKIAPGYVGDVTIVDPKKEWIVQGSEFETKCKWSPFEGRSLKGKVHTVIKEGKIKYAEYEFL